MNPHDTTVNLFFFFFLNVFMVPLAKMQPHAVTEPHLHVFIFSPIVKFRNEMSECNGQTMNEEKKNLTSGSWFFCHFSINTGQFRACVGMGNQPVCVCVCVCKLVSGSGEDSPGWNRMKHFDKCCFVAQTEVKLKPFQRSPPLQPETNHLGGKLCLRSGGGRGRPLRSRGRTKTRVNIDSPNAGGWSDGFIRHLSLHGSRKLY